MARHRLPTFAPTVTVALRHTQFITRRCAARFSTRKAENLFPSRVGSGRVLTSASVDLRFVRNNVELARQNIVDRGISADVDRVVHLYDEVLSVGKEVEALRKQRNENAALMKKAGKMSPDERNSAISTGKSIKQKLAVEEERLLAIETDLKAEAAKLPNFTHPDVPKGDEENATCLLNVGAQRDFSAEGFEPKGHLEIATDLDMVDFENAARVSGNKFYYMRNAGALLELALINWAMASAAQKGFTLMTTPDVARESVVEGCGFQPRGEASQIYRIEDSDLCLAGTSEILLGGYYAGQILKEDELPVKMAAYSHCFRKEVGAAGTITRGLYRVHQFSKVEMFVLCTPEQSDAIHEELKNFEVAMFDSLGLHFKVLDMPTKDLGHPAHRKFDIEAWMPGRGSYGEISSASNCTDYQARRLGIRYKSKDSNNGGGNKFVHTLNATACAVPRIIVAILENFQQQDGSVVVPQALRPFLGGMEVIKKNYETGGASGDIDNNNVHSPPVEEPVHAS